MYHCHLLIGRPSNYVADWISLLRGLSHLETDTECQDYVRFDQIGDTTVLVVSDGAGSVSHGQVGANRVAIVFRITFLSKLTIRF